MPDGPCPLYAPGSDKLRNFFGLNLREAPNITRIRLQIVCVCVPTTFCYITRSTNFIIQWNNLTFYMYSSVLEYAATYCYDDKVERLFEKLYERFLCMFVVCA